MRGWLGRFLPGRGSTTRDLAAEGRAIRGAAPVYAPGLPLETTPESTPEPIGEYASDRERDGGREPAYIRVIRIVRGLLLIFLAVVSLAIFWLIGLLLDIF